MSGKPVFNRVALIGMGLIGSSIARAARAQGAAGSIIATARSAATRRRIAELGLADQVVETNAAAAEGADLVIVSIPVGACGMVAAEIGPHLGAGRGRIRRRLGQGRGGEGYGAPHSRGRAFRAGASRCGHREFRAGRGLCRVVRQSLVHSHPAAGRRSGRGARGWRRSGARWAPMSRPCRPSTTTSCSASPATCRT